MIAGWAPVHGGVLVIASVLLLLAAGTQDDERRMAAATTVTGVLFGLATLPLTWIGGDAELLMLGGLGLMLGGIAWTIEAHRSQLTDRDFPAMTLVAGVPS